ncbi:uncharacterized protein METZ01_LOCUS274193 [marine metagenome]|uniref:Uncharacterized protein n=1 Tax=marine metagenome TaxID=408172 RepID=A0A382KAY2_9ZZZZ
MNSQILDSLKLSLYHKTRIESKFFFGHKEDHSEAELEKC